MVSQLVYALGNVYTITSSCMSKQMAGFVSELYILVKRTPVVVVVVVVVCCSTSFDWSLLSYGWRSGCRATVR